MLFCVVGIFCFGDECWERKKWSLASELTGGRCPSEDVPFQPAAECSLASIGIENQSDPDAVMPLRVLAYDGAEYRAQLLKGNPQKVLYPIVTIVLYFGYENEWKQKLTLKECLRVL